MPTLSRWFIKLGMLHLLVGLFLGSLMLVQPVLGLSPQFAGAASCLSALSLHRLGHTDHYGHRLLDVPQILKGKSAP